jgi:lysophospholipase L1-like esterase
MALPVPGYAMLLDAATSDTTVTFWTKVNRRYRVYLYGTFDGASVSIQVTADGGTTWIDLTDALTLTQYVEVFFSRDEGYRIVLEDAGAGTSLSLVAVQLYHHTGYGSGEGPTALDMGLNVAGELFGNGEQGFWYDLNDDSTIFQDSAGTTLASWGDPVGRVNDKSGNGNNRVQTDNAKRPIRGRMPKAGKWNELVSSDNLTTQDVEVTAVQRTLSFVGTGTVTLSGTSTAGPLVGTGSDRVSLTFTPTAGTLTLTVSGDVQLAQLQEGFVFTLYQSVGVTGFDVLQAGQVSCGYLSYNGVDQFMQLAAAFALPASTSVFAAYRNDGEQGVTRNLLDAATVNTNGRIAIVAPTGVAVNSVTTGYRSSLGNNLLIAATNSSPTGVYRVIAQITNPSGPLATQRINGSVSGTSSSVLGGDFGNIVRYFGSLNGTSNFFKGLEFGMIIRGAVTSGSLLTRTEAYLSNTTPEVLLTMPAIPDDNEIYELDVTTTDGWIPDGAFGPSIVGGVIQFPASGAATGWNKTITGPSSGDYIFYLKARYSAAADSPYTISLGGSGDQRFRISLGYNWATAARETSRVSARINATGFAGPLSATAGTTVEVAMQYDSRVGAGNFFMKESGFWKFYGSVALSDPYRNVIRVATDADANSTFDIVEAFFAKPNIVSIGDSICAGANLFNPNPAQYAGIDDYDSTWMAHANIYPEIRNNLIVNYGIGGNTSAQILARTQDMLDKTTPRLVFVHSSTNDYGASVPNATRTTNIQGTIDLVKNAGASAVLLNSVYPNAGSANSPANADYYREWWSAYSQDISGIAYKVDIMGDSAILDGNYMDTSFTQSDGVHPNVDGYTLIGDCIKYALPW